jgi:8-oxo-dGTP diphosphatase
MMKTEYVCGFCFIPNDGQVVLIRKNKPEWQAGKLNGVGGHVEPGETPLQAMAREWFEETSEPRTGWELFCTINYAKAVVHFFRTWVANDGKCLARTNTDELIVRAPLSSIHCTHDSVIPCLYAGTKVHLPMLPNLRYLIPMALSGDKGEMHQ